MTDHPPAPAEEQSAAPRSTARLTQVALAAVLCASALLRFAGIDHGIRRGEPLPDEYENFISPVMGMWDRGSADPDHRAGYPGFFNYLAFLPMGIGRQLDGVTGACLAGRVLVAAFGTLNVFLLYRLLRPGWGPAAALLGAALLGVSRSDVSEAHAITPDVLVVTAFLAMGLAFRSARPASAWPGVWGGLGLAIKHTGVILFPALLAELAVQRRLRRGLLPVLAAAAGAFAVAAPYYLVSPIAPHMDGTRLVKYYYGGFEAGGVLSGMLVRVQTMLGWIWVNLGTVAAGLALIGLAAARPRRALVFPASVLLVSGAVLGMPRAVGLGGQVYPRHVLLASAAATVLAAAGYSILARRRVLAALLAVAALFQPASRALAVAAAYVSPSELDRAGLWIEEQGRPLRVATSLVWFRVDLPAELRTGLALRELPPEALAHYDLVVAPLSVAGSLEGLARAAVFGEEGNPQALAVLRPTRPAAHAAWPAPVSTGGTAPAAERVWDGDAASVWLAPPGAGWVEARWEGPRRLHGLEVVAAPGHGLWPQRLVLSGRTGPDTWEPIEALPLRPNRTRGQQPPYGQVFLLAEERTFDALRIERRKGDEWGLAEVRAFSIGP